jgi:hypothetical protein
MSKVGALSVSFDLDPTQFTAGMKKVGSAVSSNTETLRGNAKQFALWGTVAAGAMVAFTAQSMKAIDAQAKLARTVGGTFDAITALQMAAGDAGVDGLEESLGRLNRRLGAVEITGGPAAETVKRLGLNLEQMANMDVDQRIGYIGDQINRLGISNQEAARHLQNLGFQQSSALELFKGGSTVIAGYRAEVDELGLSLSEWDTKQIERANDAMGIFGDVAQSVGQRLAVIAAPSIEAIANELQQIWIESNKAIIGTEDFEVTFAHALANILDGMASVIGFVENRPETLEFGLIGMLFFGKKGALIGGAVGVIFSQLKRMMFELGIGVDKEVARYARVQNEIKSLQALMNAPGVGAQDKQAEQQAGWAERIAVLNAELEQMNQALSPEQQAQIAGHFESSEKAADGFAGGLSRIADRLREVEALSGEMPSSVPQAPQGEGISAADQKKLDELAAWQAEAHQSLVDSNSAWLDELSARYATEAELLDVKLWDELERLQEAKDLKLLNEQEYAQRSEQIQKDHSDAMTMLQKQERQQRVAIMSSMLDNLSTLMNTGSRKLFEIGKVASIANAVLKGREAVISSYAAGAKIGGPIIGAAFAATAAAATAAQISQIRSSSFGGAGGVSSPGTSFSGGIPSVNQAQPAGAAQATRNISVSIIGSERATYSASQIRDLIDQINEQLGDGKTIGITGG